MGFFTCIRNAFTGKSNCPNNCDKDLRECKEDQKLLEESNTAYSNENESYKQTNQDLTKKNNEQASQISDLKTNLEQANEVADKYARIEEMIREYDRTHESFAKESFIGSLFTVASVFVILVIIFAAGVLIFVAFMFWRKRSKTTIVEIEESAEPSSEDIPAGLLEQ